MTTTTTPTPARARAGMSLDKSGSRIDSDGVKLFCARMAKNVADRAMQTLGGYGYVAAAVAASIMHPVHAVCQHNTHTHAYTHTHTRARAHHADAGGGTGTQL